VAVRDWPTMRARIADIAQTYRLNPDFPDACVRH
jgi:hypothetical protein